MPEANPPEQHRPNDRGLRPCRHCRALLVVPSLIALTTETLATGIGDTGAAQILLSLISQIVHIALWIVIIVESIEVVRLVYRLVVRTPAHPPLPGFVR